MVWTHCVFQLRGAVTGQLRLILSLKNKYFSLNSYRLMTKAVTEPLTGERNQLLSLTASSAVYSPKGHSTVGKTSSPSPSQLCCHGHLHLFLAVVTHCCLLGALPNSQLSVRAKLTLRDGELCLFSPLQYHL